jgi:hypothetical protein
MQLTMFKPKCFLLGLNQYYYCSTEGSFSLLYKIDKDRKHTKNIAYKLRSLSDGDEHNSVALKSD